MGDQMMFPKDWREFVEYYSIKDVDKVYTKGSCLLPELRVSQLMQHYHHDSIKRIIDEIELQLTLIDSERQNNEDANMNSLDAEESGYLDALRIIKREVNSD